MTIHGSPPCSTTSKTRMTEGWDSVAAICASRLDRSMSCSRSPGGRSGGRNTSLSATSRRSTVSSARHTEPLPPLPTRSMSRYRSPTVSPGEAWWPPGLL